MKRILVFLALLLTTPSLASGQTKAEADQPMGGKTIMIDAGGHRLNMLVAGEGAPTVILESGFAGGVQSWARVQPEVAKFT